MSPFAYLGIMMSACVDIVITSCPCLPRGMQRGSSVRHSEIDLKPWTVRGETRRRLRLRCFWVHLVTVLESSRPILVPGEMFLVHEQYNLARFSRPTLVILGFPVVL